MKEKLNAVWDFVSRHAVWLLLGLLAFILLAPGIAEKNTLLFIVLCEALALALSGTAMYAFTNIPFTKLLVEGNDKEISADERQGLCIIIAAIFIGVHLLVSIIVLGYYIAQFSGIPITA